MQKFLDAIDRFYDVLDRLPVVPLLLTVASVAVLIDVTFGGDLDSSLEELAKFAVALGAVSAGRGIVHAGKGRREPLPK